jgi:tight adherence protein B
MTGRPRWLRRLAAASVLAGAVLAGALVPAGPAAAATARVVEVSTDGKDVRLVLQADDLAEGQQIDPDSVELSVDGTGLPAQVTPLSSQSISRTGVLAIDVSRSMSPRQLQDAKNAAEEFLTSLPADVQVGLVVIDEGVTDALEPTLDRDLVRAEIDGLAISDETGTALYDGAVRAAEMAGPDGSRTVLLLTDGEEVNSQASLAEAVRDVRRSGVSLDGVYIGAGTAAGTTLQQLIDGAAGRVVSARSDELPTVFGQAAQAISSQLEVTATVPASVGRSANLTVTAEAGNQQLIDTVFARFRTADPRSSVAPSYGPEPVTLSASRTWVTDRTLPIALAALFVGGVAVLAVAGGVVSRADGRRDRVSRRLSLYTLTGRAPVTAPRESATVLGSSQVARSAVDLAGRMVRQRDVEGTLAHRLEAAGVPLRAAEWMIIHLAAAVVPAVLLLLISGGSLLPALLGLVVGLVLPWAYLVVKESRRTSAFLGQLPDTLQLVAGSLKAGYSMAQALDTVVREGQQPITGEFNRALVEARLGVPVEDALDGVAARMHSKDFAWVVLAIRIQREVGGNLAELLTTVAETLRERERLRRQVSVLSAEGRLSAWVLGALPPVFALYLALVRPEYLEPLVTKPLGILLIVVGTALLGVGVLWMRKAVRVEV